ncbi:signal peptidase I [Georgenia wutianyii]|uniref:Signal peptidase I n=1 Tax=Georgenia wutianyii TaxID=2585135 RepID=A0ABX5VJF9_9MICO|nr:signal peptidase I [Georgenia wutianyii]
MRKSSVAALAGAPARAANARAAVAARPPVRTSGRRLDVVINTHASRTGQTARVERVNAEEVLSRACGGRRGWLRWAGEGGPVPGARAHPTGTRRARDQENPVSNVVLTARHRDAQRPRRLTPMLLARLVPAVALAVLLVVLALLVVLPRLLGWAPLTVLTGSMEPTIPTGSQVVVAPVRDVATLEVGDVVTVMPYPDTPTLVTHRIVARTDSAAGPTFVTQGDANDAVDGWEVTETQIRGEVRYWVPLAGYVATVLTGHTKALGLLVVALALFGYAAAQVGAVARERQAGREAVPAAADVPAWTRTAGRRTPPTGGAELLGEVATVSRAVDVALARQALGELEDVARVTAGRG